MGHCHFLERCCISTKVSRSKQPIWTHGLNLPAIFILEPLIGQRKLIVKESAITSKSLSLSAFSAAPPPPTQRRTRARASSKRSPSGSFGIMFKICCSVRLFTILTPTQKMRASHPVMQILLIPSLVYWEIFGPSSRPLAPSNCEPGLLIARTGTPLTCRSAYCGHCILKGTLSLRSIHQA
uniref:Uncharacterized protein n=1 Tax=Opuntia streptacantha TaxID=393608 RepID=A0A7C9EWB0_OPUST